MRYVVINDSRDEALVFDTEQEAQEYCKYLLNDAWEEVKVQDLIIFSTNKPQKIVDYVWKEIE